MEKLEHPSLASLFFSKLNQESFPGWYQRKNDEWVYYSRERLNEETRSIAIAFHNHGLLTGESIGIIAPTSPSWVMIDVATQINHAQIVPLFPNISSENFVFQCNDSNVGILVVDKISDLDLPLKEHLSIFKTIICIDKNEELPPQGIYLEDLIEEGKNLLLDNNNAQWVQSNLESINPDDLFSIIYTSGSTGTPKGVELSHRNMLTQIQDVRPMHPLYQESDVLLTILPIAHVFERMITYYCISFGVKAYFADTPKNAAKFMTEIKPTVMAAVPRILERVYESMTAAGDNAKGPKRWLIKNAIKTAKIEDPMKRPSIYRRIYDRLVYKKMREAIGGRFRTIVSGSCALNKSICRFLLNIGIPVFEGYGLTECSPVVSVNTIPDQKPGSVGKILKSLTVKIGENNEVLVKGDSVFRGYHNLPELNKEIFTEDGFFKTGDQGSIDSEGFLSLTGRIKELLKTSTGKYVCPGPIELELSRHPVVEQALVIANERKFASAVIFLNPEGARRLLKMSKEEFSVPLAMESKRIREAIQRHITRINKKLSHWEQIQKWTLIGDELTTESGLLTPTLKIRRKAAEQKYKDAIEAIYA